jgi:dolichol-phosphate mannosyltransferase
MKCLVIIPTYNESENVQQIITAVLAQVEQLHVLIVDDNSPDGTAGIVESMIENDTRIHLIRRAGKLGLGSAYVTGFKYAIEQGYELIIQMDADFSHDPIEIPKFLELIETHDLVVGSRYKDGIGVVNWPISRLLLSYGAAQYVKIITSMPIKDPTGGYKCIRTEVLKNINLDKILSDGYSFQIEINYRIWLKKYNVFEYPIVFTDRRVGQSKMSKKIVREAIYMVWKLKFYQLFGKL